MIWRRSFQQGFFFYFQGFLLTHSMSPTLWALASHSLGPAPSPTLSQVASGSQGSVPWGRFDPVGLGEGFPPLQ